MVKTKVCSWDVGIKNLSYCILEKEDNNVKIHKWGIINLSDTSFTDLICTGVFKNNKRCTHKCKVYLDTSGVLVGYCKQHKTQYNPFIKGWDTKLIKVYDGDNEDNEDKKCKFMYPKKKTICNKKSKYVTNNNIHYCTSHQKAFIKNKKKEITLQPIKTKKCTDADMGDLTEKMYRAMDKIPELLQVDSVLIENQPVKKNPTMKTVASVLFGYFVLNGIVNKKITNSDIINVKFSSPTNKLKVDKEKTKLELSKGTTLSQKYAIGKKLAKKYCVDLVSKMTIINKPNEWKTFYDTHKKKDDLADSFLQGYYELMNAKDFIKI